MITLIRTDSENADFQKLVVLLDQYLKLMDGDDHAFYASYNKVDSIKNVVVCYHNNVAVGCGAFKKYDRQTAEIKRMYVQPGYRNKGIAAAILNELEQWAKENNYTACILETGKKQTAAISFYHKTAYLPIENYGQYAGVENSVCFKKLMA